MTTFTAECIHCHEQVGEPFPQIGEAEERRLRDHLARCAIVKAKPRSESVGELLNHFTLKKLD